jgi:Pyridoxamine 5'-phosphate oxidase
VTGEPFDVAGFLAEAGRMAQVAAVSPGGVPLLGSVWFRFADGRFWFSSHPSTPFAAAAGRGAAVAVLVDQFAPPDAIRQVRVRGAARVEPHDPDRVEAIYRRYLGAGAWPEFFRTRVHDTDWTLWTVTPDSGVVTGSGFRPTEHRWHRREEAPAALAQAPAQP